MAPKFNYKQIEVWRTAKYNSSSGTPAGVQVYSRWVGSFPGIEQTRFKYYSTWDENVLRETREGIDPAKTCPEIFRKLKITESNDEKYEIVRSDWSNCVFKLSAQKLGPYPMSSWNGFLSAFGITEKYEQTGPD